MQVRIVPSVDTCLTPWQASFSILIHQMCMPYAVSIHTDLQGTHVAWPLALTVCHSAKASSLTRGPILACLLTSCSNSGMTGSTCTLATFSSGLAAIARSGGRATSVQRAFHTSGRLLLCIGLMGPAVLSAQAWLFVSTIRLPERHLKLRCFGMPEEPSQVSRSSDCLQRHESSLEVQRLLARMAGSGDDEGARQDWVLQVCKGKRLQETRRHKAEAPHFCSGKASLAAAMES